MYRSKRSIAQASKGKDKATQPVQDTGGQVTQDASKSAENVFKSSSNQSMTTDPSTAQPQETDGPPGFRSSQKRSFQAPQDTGAHPIQGMTSGNFASETQASSFYEHWEDAPAGTEPTQAEATEANDDGRLNQRNAAGTERQSVPPPNERWLDDSPRQTRSLKRKVPWDQEDDDDDDDDEPGLEGLSGKRKKPAKWSEDIEFDESEEVEMRDSKGKRGKKGGKILPRHVWSLQPGVRFVVPFNTLDQPVGKGGYVLVRFLADVAKNGELCPISEVNWHKVDKSHKADIITLIREKFVLPPHEQINRCILKYVGHRLRGYRHELKTQYKKPGKTEEQVASVVPKGVVPSQWVKLVNYWFSDKCEFLSTKGKEARAAQSHQHTTGSKSFARMRDEFEKKHGREPGALEWFVKTHQRKDGTYVHNTSKEFLDVATTKVAQHAPSSSSQRIAVENEVFNELMYSDENENHKKPIGYGFGVNRRKITGVEGELRRRGYWQLAGSGEDASYGIKEEGMKSSYMGADTSAEVERLNFAVMAMSETNGLMQTQLKMQSKQLKMQSQQLQMQSEQMEALQSQLQQVTSLVTKFGSMLNKGPTHSMPLPRGPSRLPLDISYTTPSRRPLDISYTQGGPSRRSVDTSYTQGGPSHRTVDISRRRAFDIDNIQVLEDSDDSIGGESESSAWDSE